MRSDLLACALGAGCSALSSIRHRLAIFAVSGLSCSHEVLVDRCATICQIGFVGVLLLSSATSSSTASVARLDRCANRERLYHGIADDVGLVEEARVVVLADHTVVRIEVQGMWRLGEAEVTAASRLMQVQRGGRSSTAGQMSVGTIREVLAASLVVEACWILRLRRVNRSDIGAVLRVR